MKPANTPLTRIDLGTPALQWPDFDRVTISLQSPDDKGAVAYYFDTLAKSGKAGDHWGAVGRAACAYLLGLVRSRSLQLVRGPYLTVAEDAAVPDGWTMIRAMVWVEEFDVVVEPEPVYFVTINGRSYEVETRDGRLTYSDVVIFADMDPELNPTVTYRRTETDGGGGGVLTRGQSVRIRQRGTVFDVAHTGSA